MANNLLPPDIDEITGSEEWKTFTPDQRNALVDDWALQVRNAGDWSPDELKSLDDSVDYFRENALETFGEQAKRIVKEGAVGGVKSLAALPLAVPKLGLQTGKLIGYGGDPNVSSRELTEAAPEVATMATGAEKMVQGLDTLRRQYNPFSDTDEEWEGEFDSLRKDILDRKLSEDPDQLYDYLKKKAFNIAKQNARFYGGEVEDYMPQEFQGGNDEQIFKQYFNSALEGKRPEGFIEFRDDTVPQQGLVTKNQSRSLITSPENLGLLMKFSATRNPMYFEALKQRLGRSRDRQITEARAEEIEDQRGEGDFFDDAAQTIFSGFGYSPETGEMMKEEVRGLASSPVDIASTLFSFGLGKAAVKKAVERNLLGAAGDVAKGAGTEFVEGALSAVGDQAIPELGNIAEQGLMEAVGGGVMQAAGAGAQGIQELRRPSVEGEVAEAVETTVEPIAEAPLLTPEEQEAFADADEQRAIADEAEPVAPLAAEALRELAVETENEVLMPEEVEGDVSLTEEAIAETQEPVAEQPSGPATASIPIMVTQDMTQQLLDMGYTSQEVNAMRPEQAQAAISAGGRPSQTNVQGTNIDQGAGGTVVADARSATSQIPAPVGAQPSGGQTVAPQVQAVTPSTIPFGDPDPVGRLASQIQDAEQAEVNPESKAKLTAFSQQLPAILDRYRNLFSGVMFTRLQSGGGVNAGELTDSLRIDPQRVLDTIQTAPTTEDSVAAFETMLDEEFRHRVSLELDRTSPDFKRDLQALWDNLTPEIKTASAELYFKQTGAQYDSDWQAKHEFFRQYWQDADFRALTETSLKEGGKYEFLQRLIDSFLKALKSLREGADANVKPILDRLIAQAQQRANEIRAQATQTQPTDAVQIQEPAGVDARQQTTDGETVGERYAQRQETPREGQPEEKIASLKRAEVDARRERMGAPAIPTIDTLGWSESDREAARILQENPNAARDLIAARKAEPRPLTQTENALLLFDQARLQNEILKLSEDLEKVPAGVENDLQRGELLAIINSRETELLENDYVYRRGGSESGRSLNSLKMEKALDRSQYTLAKMLLRYRADVTEGKALTQEERSAVTENHRKIKKAFEEEDAIEEEKQKEEAEPVFKKIIQIARKEKADADETLKQKSKKHFKDSGKYARERLKERKEKGLSAPSGLDAPAPQDENFEDYAIVGAEYIEDGAKSLEAFTEKMTGEFGSGIQSQIEPIYNRAKEIHSDAVVALQKEQAKAKEAAKPSSVLEAGKKRLEGKPMDKVDASLAVKLFKAHVRSSPLASPEEINSLVTKDIQTIYPTATESDVRVAITGYGKAKWPNKDAFAKRERDHKSILRQLETQDRLLKGQAPLKTGLQRDKPSARYRELEAQNKELMKKMGFETTAAGQLASTKKAISNRFKNQIEDLNRIIEGKAKPKTPREQVQYDAELNALKKERDELQSYVDDLTGPSKEGKWNQKKQKAYERTIENYKRRIAQQDFAARSKPGYQESEATKNLREEMEDARAEFETLKDLSGETVKEQLAREENRLDREIDKVTEEIATGKTPPAGKPKPSNAEIEAKKQHLKILKETRRHIKDANKDDSTRAKATEKSLERSIAELDRRIKHGDTKPAERRASVENERIKQLRQDRDFLKEIYAGMKAAAEGRRIPEEITLDNFKRYIQKKIREDQQKLGKKEYLEVPTDNRIDTLRERALNAKAATAKTKKEWMEAQFNAKLKNKKGYEKFKDRFGEVLGLMRAFMTGAEFSAILRQGKFALGHPFVFGRSLPSAWKAFRSEEGLLRIQQEIESRDNFKNGAYDDLAIVDPYSVSLTKMEEDFQSRWANKVPFIAGTARSYAGFLNLLRANMFDVIANNHTGGRRPLTPVEAKSFAALVNNLTGRGSLGKYENAGPFLNRILFSPKFLASRLNLLTGRGVIWDARPETRKTIAKEYARALAAQMALYALYAMFFKSDDEEIEVNPRSGDFLKIPIGPNTKIDPGAGLLQLIVLASRLWTGESKKKDGEIVALRGEDASPAGRTMEDIQYNFVRSKLAPIPGFLLNLSLQSGYGGSDYSILPQEASIQSYLDSELGKMTVPMTWAEIREAGQDLGLSKGAIMALFMMAGEGVQSFPDKETRSR